MYIGNVTVNEVRQALEDTNKKYNDNIYFSNDNVYTCKNGLIRFKLEAYSPLELGYYYCRHYNLYNSFGKNKICSHAQVDFVFNMFLVNPDAEVRVGVLKSDIVADVFSHREWGYSVIEQFNKYGTMTCSCKRPVSIDELSQKMRKKLGIIN